VRDCEHFKEEAIDMSVLKSMMMLGIGVATVTREKAEEVVEDLIRRGEVASADKAQVIDEIQQRAQSATADVKRLVDERIEIVGKKLRWFEEMNELRTEVEELRSRVADLEAERKEPETQ
jgi:polyhydroxyalkanoate synthesis regulator phasin